MSADKKQLYDRARQVMIDFCQLAAAATLAGDGYLLNWLQDSVSNVLRQAEKRYNQLYDDETNQGFNMPTLQ